MNLFTACRIGSIKEFDKAIREGADINQQDFMGITPIMAILQSQSEKLFFHVMKNYVPDLRKETLNKNTVLSYAAKYSKTSILINLIDKLGLKYVFAPNAQGFSPLMIAAINGNMHMIECLDVLNITNEGKQFIKDNINNQTNFDNSFLSKGPNNLHIHYMEDTIYLTRYQTLLCLSGSAMDNKYNLVLPKVRIDNYKHFLGDTALMLAVQFREYVFAISLMRIFGADVNIQNRYGYSAVMLAAKNHDQKMINLLVDFGANLNLRCHAKKLERPILDESLGNKSAIDMIREAAYPRIISRVRKQFETLNDGKAMKRFKP